MVTSFSKALTTTLVLLVMEYSLVELISYLVRVVGNADTNTFTTITSASTMAVIIREYEPP